MHETLLAHRAPKSKNPKQGELQMDNFDDFDIGIQCDELVPDWYEAEDGRGLTADERGLDNAWRDECFQECTADDEDELVAVFGADDPDNYLGDPGDTEEGGDDDW